MASAFALAGLRAATADNGAEPMLESGPHPVAVSTLFPGGGSPPPPDPRDKLYDGDPQAIAEGKRLFGWYNCAGCHFHGGGGIGPALMDDVWIYGGSLDQIFDSIHQGRPNGMPYWGEKIPDEQIWQLAAFVRSMSVPSAVNISGEPIPSPPPQPAGSPKPPTPSTSGPAGAQ